MCAALPRSAVVVTLDIIVGSGRGESILLRIQSLAFQYKVKLLCRWYKLILLVIVLFT